MNSNSSAGPLFAIVAAVLGFVMVEGAPPATPQPVEPLPATSLDLRPAFSANTNVAERRIHAADLRRIFAVSVAGIEWDGRQAASERAFRNGTQLDRHVVTVRKFFTEEWTFRSQYPSLGETVEKFLLTRLGPYVNGEINDAARREWINSLKEIQSACMVVEGG